MHVLRTSSMLARLILAWFVLLLGVAAASPFVHPKTMEVVCSAGGGVKIVYTDADGEPVQANQHTLDCSLCLPAGAPVPMVSVALSAPAREPRACGIRPGPAPWPTAARPRRSGRWKVFTPSPP